jgi:hypothetical protein
MTRPPPHLTYCTNIHAAESWPEVFAALREHVVAVKRRVSPDEPFGVGLRLSGQAARELSEPRELRKLAAFLDANALYVFTLNGFPYGQFHGTRVKENVYRPDWLEALRGDYTQRMCELLAALLPRDVEGSVSTVPGAFKARIGSAEDEALIATRLIEQVAGLHRLFERTGKKVSLALEPEPCCQLETIAETVAFFQAQLFSRVGQLSKLTGLSAAASDAFLRHHLGVCFDACHVSVEFEDMRAALAALQRAGIRIVKTQLSAGLQVSFDPSELGDVKAALRPFADPVYLHQVVQRCGGELSRFVDLGEAFAARAPSGPSEWRIHFHVPLYVDGYGRLGNTQSDLRVLLEELRSKAISDHLEVETYTWSVLPQRGDPIDVSIARELQWVKEQL